MKSNILIYTCFLIFLILFLVIINIIIIYLFIYTNNSNFFNYMLFFFKFIFRTFYVKNMLKKVVHRIFFIKKNTLSAAWVK